MQKKINWKSEAKAWSQIIIGCFIVAMGFVVFINPYKLVPGGVFGSSVILHQLWPQLQVGTYSYMLQIPLMIITILLVGKKLGVRTLFTVLITPLIMNIATLIAYPNADAVMQLDATQLFGGKIDLSEHLVIAALFGGAIVGCGTGLIIRNQSGTGGTDLVGMIIHKYLHTKFTKAVLIVDSCIIVIGLIVTGSVILSLYSLIAIVALNKGLGLMLSGTRDAKIIYIICEESTDEIHDYIIHDLDITATRLLCKGLYSGERKDMLMMVVHDKMVPRITKDITQFAPDAFLVVADAFETFGERWRSFPEQDDLML